MLGLLAAGFSTLEGVILALSTIFGNDFYGTIARARGVSAEELQVKLLRVGRIFLVVLAPITLLLSWRQIVDQPLSVAIFAQNGIYALFATIFAPVLFGIFSRKATAPLVPCAAVTALVVHFGMYYGEITHYHTNPAVPATCALVISTLVIAIGVALTKADGGTVSRDEALQPSGEDA
jgi:SSS family solute:Na+ symporter/sodium/pantothenate symporter